MEGPNTGQKGCCPSAKPVPLDVDDFCGGIERRQCRQQLALAICRNEIRFVYEQDVCEFHLVCEQIRHRALVFVTHGLPGILEVFGLPVLLEKMRGVDHGDHRGKAGDFFYEVVPQRAANGAIRHFHEFFFRAREPGTTVANEGSVDVCLAHIIDDHSDPPAFAIV